MTSVRAISPVLLLSQRDRITLSALGIRREEKYDRRLCNHA